MKAILICILSLTFMATSVFAEDKPASGMDPKKQEMMKAYMEYSKPGAPHKLLGSLAGQWKYTSKWWESADAKPEVTNGTATMKMALGGRYLEQDIKGKAMGMPFQGKGYHGYNNVTKKYETHWMDNMATGMMHGTSEFDESTKTFKESGEYTCPISEDKKREYRSEWKIIDKNNMLYTMYGPGVDDDKEFKQMEMAYKRVR